MRNFFRQKHFKSNKMTLKPVHLMKEAQIEENENNSDHSEEKKFKQVNDGDYSMENDENGQSENGDVRGGREHSLWQC